MTRDSEIRIDNTPAQRVMIALTVAVVLFHLRCGTHNAASVPPENTTTAPELVFMAIYERGPRYDDAKSIFEQPSIKEHIAHHEALGSRLIAAGPLRPEAGSNAAGVVIIKAPDIAAAREWLNNDPAVVSGTLQATIAQWRVSRISAYERSK